jgi:hypothetical protein
MPLQDHLASDETVLASATGRLGSNLYATNKRVVRYSKGMFQEKVNSLYYPHIVGTEYESHSYRGLIVAGIMAILLGAIFDWFCLQLALNVVGNAIFVLFCVLGVLLILIGIFAKPIAYYQIKAMGLTERELLLWRTANAEPEARAFAGFIQGQISVREMPPPPPAPEREVITREVVMIKCEYCGGLMLQTSTFCPNCGARRQT